MRKRESLQLHSSDKIGSHLEQEMYEQLTIFKKQITAIKQILEECNEKKHTDDSSNNANRV